MSDYITQDEQGRTVIVYQLIYDHPYHLPCPYTVPKPKSGPVSFGIERKIHCHDGNDTRN